MRILNIPRGKDPDEFIRSYGNEGQARFRLLIKNSANDIEYQLKKEENKYDTLTTEGKIAYLKNAVKILSKVNNKIEQEIYAGKLSEAVGIDKGTIMSQITKEYKKHLKLQDKKRFKEIQKNLSAQQDHINKEKSKNLRSATAEEAIIAFMLSRPECIKDIQDKLPSEKILTSFNKRIYEFILAKFRENGIISIADFREAFDSDEISKITGYLARETYRNSDFNAAQEYIDIIWQENEKLAGERLDNAGANVILEYIDKLREQKK